MKTPIKLLIVAALAVVVVAAVALKKGKPAIDSGNATPTAIATAAPPETANPVTTVALHDIAAGEEITCDYFSFDADAPRKLGRASI